MVISNCHRCGHHTVLSRVVGRDPVCEACDDDGRSRAVTVLEDIVGQLSVDTLAGIVADLEMEEDARVVVEGMQRVGVGLFREMVERRRV